MDKFYFAGGIKSYFGRKPLKDPVSHQLAQYKLALNQSLEDCNDNKPNLSIAELKEAEKKRRYKSRNKNRRRRNPTTNKMSRAQRIRRERELEKKVVQQELENKLAKIEAEKEAERSFIESLDLEQLTMLRNVEIKAKIKDFKAFLEIARKITDTTEVVLNQEDTYFRVPHGRLKMRQIQGGHTQLVFYRRPDTAGPKMSNYRLQEFQNVEEANGLKEVLKSSLGILGIVTKERHLFMVGQTRIHVDDVLDIGHFMELEVVLQAHQSLDYGQAVANDLMSKLNISIDDLMQGSYIDLL